ncbi:glycoside hydrolase family 38 N-terminal domain-containing protein [Paenibacillus tuaregi]|uniref:glycoside hydrolase family 38 N-terminal domain-containing protein n=1 Tax=Paenibacillus tuaregi TaxID=1816681 RepID=UPI0008391360|nr:glycoside hydrolase [Paenibacillus tuaregi]
MSTITKQPHAPSRPWTIYVIHHSHTDIGYTERQERIEQYHVDFIRQALKICNTAHTQEHPEWKSFRWTCETFWAVEQFLKEASPDEQEAFQQAVTRGQIELSGTYLNMTELPDFDLLLRNHSKAQQYASSFGHRIDSAMTADINGYSWGYASSLLQNDIEHLFSCIHTHHGMYPLGRKQTPFWWEAPDGGRLLVWNGEHYMFGNELAFCPGALGKYIIKDEFQHNLVEPEHRHNEIAALRINRYLWNLEQETYPYSFVPVMISGLGTDNASPNGEIAEWIAEWNEQHGDRITIKMATLSEFFSALKQEDLSSLPVHQGDWPDWWTDGVASTAMHTQVYRDAQRTLRKVKRLNPGDEVVAPEDLDKAAQALTMYAEHTWGFHSSVYEPWHPQVQMLEVRKQAYAAEASTRAYRALDKALAARNGALLAPGRPLRYEVINTEPAQASLQVAIPLDGWETTIVQKPFELIDESTGASIPYQLSPGRHLITELTLEPDESRILHIRPLQRADEPSPIVTARNNEPIACEGISDIWALPEASYPVVIGDTSIESDFFRIEWALNKGITSWTDKTRSCDLMDAGHKHAPFTPVYEVTSVQGEHTPPEMCAVRSRMGRNRKGSHVERDTGRLVRAKVLDNGSLYALLELTFEVKGLSYYAIHLKMFANQPRVEVSIRLHKDSVWLPENLYVALPFSMGPQAELYVEKAGCFLRPWKDQIPGSCLDYTCAQEGVFWHSPSDREALLVSMTDTPLVQLGSLEHGPRKLHGAQAEGSRPLPYAWLLTNYWETNFKATLGGFYEFRYAVERRSQLDPAEAANALHASTGQFTVHRIR